MVEMGPAGVGSVGGRAMEEAEDHLWADMSDSEQ